MEGKIMDLQGMVNAMNEQQARDRGNYHLSYGELIKALRAAPADAEFDEQVKGIGSWRGSYIEIALFTNEDGYSAIKEGYSGNYSDYMEWTEAHPNNDIEGELPRNAHKLADLLESLIGKYFTGYKGGDYEIEEYKPLWLEFDSGSSNGSAIIGIDENLKLITKEADTSNE